MFIVRLIYASTISQAFNEDDIERILESARHNNIQNHVTGLLCFNRKYFLQCLEGSRDQVNMTFHKILNDPRHENAVILEYNEITEREFTTWNMGYLPESRLTQTANLQFSGSPEFDPYSMTGESAHKLMCSLSKTVPIV